MAIAEKATGGRAQAAETVNMDAILKETQARLLERPEFLQMRLENETIMAECRVRPRDFEAIKAELKDQLAAFPDMAMDAIYHKPVGKDESHKMKYADGLSIRAAEVLSEVYGYNRVRCDASPTSEAKDVVKIEATFTDFQRGRIWQDAGIISAYYKTRQGGTARYPEDRFFNVIVKAEAAKRVREVVLRSVNAGLKAWFETECRKIQGQLLTGAKVQEIVDKFGSLGVTLEQLENAIGRPAQMGWTLKDRQALLGIWNAIKDGEATVAEAFGSDGGRTGDDKKPGGGGATMADLVSSPEPAAVSQPPAGDGESLPAEEPLPDAQQQAAEQAGLVADYEGMIENSRTTGELSALEAQAKANKHLTQTSLSAVLLAIIKRGQVIAPKPTSLAPRRGRPPKNSEMFPA